MHLGCWRGATTCDDHEREGWKRNPRHLVLVPLEERKGVVSNSIYGQRGAGGRDDVMMARHTHTPFVRC